VYTFACGVAGLVAIAIVDPDRIVGAIQSGENPSGRKTGLFMFCSFPHDPHGVLTVISIGSHWSARNTAFIPTNQLSEGGGWLEPGMAPFACADG
jgi:hypothetical protein